MVQNQGGIAVPNGSISLQLNIDATIVAAPNGLVFSDQELVFQFDANGDLVQPCLIWSNLELNPQNASGLATFYLVTIYDADGARINSSPMWWQFTQANGATVDISQMTAYQTVSGNVIFYPIPNSNPPLPGGANTDIQVNNLGAFYGDGNFTWDKTLQIFSVIGNTDLTGSLAIQTVTPAVALANQNSPVTSIIGTVWNGSISIADTWTIQDILGGGTNGTSTLTFTHTGSSGTASVNIIGNLNVTGTITGSGSVVGPSSAVQFNNGGVLGGDAGLEYVSATSLTLSTLTPATGGGNHNAPALVFHDSYWNGSASQTGSWLIADSVGAGTNPLDQLTISYSGSSGGSLIQLTATTINISGTLLFGNSRGTSLVFGQNIFNNAVGTIASVANAVGSTTTYTGAFSSNRPSAGMYVTIAGFTNGVNNGRFLVNSSGATTLVVYNASGASEVHAATATTDTANISSILSVLDLFTGTYALTGSASGISSYSIEENLIAPPATMPLILSMSGNATDSAFLHVVNNPATGDHGFEIGGVIDGTGTAPIYIRLGVFGGSSVVAVAGVTVQIGAGASTPLSSPAQSASLGPASMVVVGWEKRSVNGTIFWSPLFQ